MLGAILLILLALFLLGAVPAWPSSGRWGFMPTGALGLLVLVMLVLLLLTRV